MFTSSQWLSLLPSPKSRPDNEAAETEVPEVGTAQELLYAALGCEQRAFKWKGFQTERAKTDQQQQGKATKPLIDIAEG